MRAMLSNAQESAAKDPFARRWGGARTLQGCPGACPIMIVLPLSCLHPAARCHRVLVRLDFQIEFQPIAPPLTQRLLRRLSSIEPKLLLRQNLAYFPPVLRLQGPLSPAHWRFGLEAGASAQEPCFRR